MYKTEDTSIITGPFNGLLLEIDKWMKALQCKGSSTTWGFYTFATKKGATIYLAVNRSGEIVTRVKIRSIMEEGVLNGYKAYRSKEMFTSSKNFLQKKGNKNGK